VSLGLRFAAGSDVGLRRDGNEDSGYAGPRLLAIADGVGGAAAGEVASSVTIAHVAELDEDSAGADLLAALHDAAAAANDEIRALIDTHPPLTGMSTTLTALLWAGGRLGLAHVGDSRGYLYRDGELQQITHDHTFVQTLVDEGRLSADEANVHPQRSLILRALDGRADPELDLTLREALDGDRYLLCSDGLSDIVSAQTIRDTLAADADPQHVVDRLIELALRGGGPDNITCVLGDVVDGSAGSAGTTPIVVGAAAMHSPQTSADRAALAESAAGRAALAGRPHTEQTAPTASTVHRHRRRWWPIIVVTAAVLAVVAGVAVGGWAYVRHQYYVGPDGTTVAVFRGVDGSVAGVSLHSVHQRTDIPLSLLPAFERERVNDGITAHGVSGAQRIVDRLRTEVCASLHPSPLPTHRPSPRPRPHGSRRATARPRVTTTPAPAPTLSPQPTPSVSCPAVLR
jgi:serine/threonine protein phosphatase PrpC